jgi:hypothetical protein
MKFFIIKGADDQVLTVFRVNEKGLPEEWNKEAKTWMFKPYLWELNTYNCHYSNEITATRAAELVGNVNV